MKKILLFVTIICLATACQYKSGSGDLVTQTRNLGDFTGVDVGGGFDVEIKTGSSIKVVVEADDNVIDDIKTSIDNGQLKISLKNGMSYNDVHMKVFVTAPEINKISGSASADVEVKDELSSENKIVLNASSGSSIKATLNAPETNADASSGAEINLKGRTRNFDAQSSSGASVNASDLLSENTIASSSSGGTVEVHASVKLNAKASSGGSVSYRGAATVISNVNSGGSINKKE